MCHVWVEVYDPGGKIIASVRKSRKGSMVFWFRSIVVLSLCAAGASACGSKGGTSTPPTNPTPVTVTGVTVTGLNGVTPPVVGDTVQFTATATFSDGTTQTVTAQATWESSNTAIVTITSG